MNITGANMLMVIFLFIQLVTFTWGQYFPPKLNALLFFGSSIGIGMVCMIYFYGKKIILEKKEKSNSHFVVLAILLAIIGILMWINHTIFLKHPIIAKESDVIPTIIELCQRFISGNEVYAPIEKFGYHLPVTYLPMQWVPYLPAAYLDFDYRYIVLVIWVISFLIIFKSARNFNNPKQLFSYGVLFLTPYFLSSVLVDKPIGGIMFQTVEFMVAAYYILLMKSINSKNAVWRGIIVGICLMSRYSLVLWLPLAVIVLWLNEPRKKLYITLVTLLIFIVCIYIIPFLSHDWMAFYKGYKYYDNAALGEWTVSYDGSGLPHHLFRGFGFASFIYQYTPNLPIEAKIALLQKIHLIASLSLVGLLNIFYLKIKRSIDYRIFLMASFKIYIALFLFLIQVPYQYLMLTDVYISIMLIWELSRYRIVNQLPQAETTT
ncbi:MAG TPA: hypothetical protein VLZ83_05040 [Edaphocola sp.]|nr:hypothetical protein [Edaphocola sp.]